MTQQEWAVVELADRAAVLAAMAANTGRNDQLFRDAVFLAGFVKAGLLDEGAWRASWTAAAQACQLGGREIGRTLDSAWRTASADDVTVWEDGAGWGGPPPPMIGGKRRPRPRPPGPRLTVHDRSAVPIPVSPIPAAESGRAVPCVRYPSWWTKAGTRADLTWAELAAAVRAPIPADSDPLPLWGFHEIEGDSQARILTGELDTAGKPETRAPANTTSPVLVLDYDDDPEFGTEAVARWWGAVRYVTHTSRSHLKAKGQAAPGPRGRVILALSRPITEEDLATILPWLLSGDRGQPGAVELRNLRRAYFVPVDTPHYGAGVNMIPAALDVDALIAGLTESAEPAAPDPSTPPDRTTWGLLRRRVKADGTESIEAAPLNLHTIFVTDPRWAGRIRFCQFRHRILLTPEDGPARPITDPDLVQAMIWVHRVYGLKQPKEAVHDVWSLIARDHGFHPVREYLDGLTWDGVERIDNWLHTCLGCPDDPLSRAMGACTLIAAVARVFQPGCKVDTVLILVGPQGRGKSTALRILAGDPWFADSPFDVRNKDAAQGLPGVWLYEISELDALRRAEKSAIKAFLTIQSDHYRPTYQRCAVDIPRQTVFVGTTNQATFLDDNTGSRRFWPRTVGRIDLGKLTEDRDQLWAEAAHKYRGGSPWWFDQDLEAVRIEAAEAFEIEEPWVAVLHEALVGKDDLTLAEIVGEKGLGIPAEGSRRAGQRAGPVLRVLGWEPYRTNPPTGPRRTRWRRKKDPE